MEYVKVVSYLISEFKFGFELEALSTVHKYNDLGKVFKNYFKGGEIVEDLSIKGKGTPFEYNSPILKATPLNLKRFKDLLLGLPKYKIYTNKTCGLHIHVSFPRLSLRSTTWVILNLATNPKYLKHITKFKSYKFVDEEHANAKFLNEVAAAFQEKDYTTLYELMSTTKYRIVRIHPQGTLEWRGPRNFLNRGNIKHINDFITHLYKYIKMLNTILESNDLKGEYKEDILNEIFLPSIKQKTQEELSTLKKRFRSDQDPEIAMMVLKKFLRFFENSGFKDLLVTKISKKLIIDDVEWNYGKFEDGIWKNGIWHNGLWKKGIWENGLWESGEWQDGIWKGGEWQDGRWVSGTWRNGIWNDGIWEEGTWESGKWQGGLWVDGEWQDGEWRNGTWLDGTWQGGLWVDGEWQDGEWRNGTWLGGYDKERNYHPRGDSPDKWEIGV